MKILLIRWWLWWRAGAFCSPREYAPGAGIGVVLWVTDKIHIRVVTVDTGHKLCTQSYDTTHWDDAEVQTRCAADSACAVVDIGAGGLAELRVYYQREDGTIGEYGSRGGYEWVPVRDSIPTATT